MSRDYTAGIKPEVLATFRRTVNYGSVLQAENVLGSLGVTTSQVDLANVIRAVVEDLDHLTEAEQEALVPLAFNHLVARPEGVPYDAQVGELYYSTVRDAISDAMEAVFPSMFRRPEDQEA